MTSTGTIHFMAPQAELYDYRVFGATGMDGDEGIAKVSRILHTTCIPKLILRNNEHLSLYSRQLGRQLRMGVKLSTCHFVLAIQSYRLLNQQSNLQLAKEWLWFVRLETQVMVMQQLMKRMPILQGGSRQ